MNKIIRAIKRTYFEIIRLLFGYKKIKDDSFFKEPTIKDYNKLVGRCFIQVGGGDVIKVLAVPTDKKYYEFIFERYTEYLNGKWYIQDYNWLQDTVFGKFGINSKNYAKNSAFRSYVEPYIQYALISSQVDMNVSSEDMYQLGIDGNIYINIGCSDTWLRYREISNKKFEKIKEKAIKNGKFEINGNI